MDPQDAIDLGREALWTVLLIGSPVLVAGMIVGLVISLFQALTQIQEQSVVFVPKLIVMLLVLSVTLPWLISPDVAVHHRPDQRHSRKVLKNDERGMRNDEQWTQPGSSCSPWCLPGSAG